MSKAGIAALRSRATCGSLSLVRSVLVAVALAVVSLGAFAGASDARAEPPRQVDAGNLPAMIAQGVKVVDIRRADEWRDTGVIAGSLLLTAVDADGRLVAGFPEALMKAVDRDEPVVVICRSGNRSAMIARMMSERGGYIHVVDAAGGIRAWIDAGNPLTPCPGC